MVGLMEACMLTTLRRQTLGRIPRKLLLAIGGALLVLIPVRAAIDADDTAQTVTFSKDVAPIFQAKCQQCHHPGTAAPMSLTTYAEARPYARSIGVRVASREMPPWHLDKTVGIREYKNDLSLNDSQIATIAAWVAAGAPQGNPSDMPKPLTFAPEGEWAIGKPDLVISTDETMHMYAKGPDWWISYFANTGLTEDRYIKAVQIKPGNPRIVHHAIAAIVADPDHGIEGGQLHEYAVGKYGDVFGDNTGRLLKAGSRLSFDMHYFAVGEEQTDRTQIAFVFYPKGFVPKYEVRSILFQKLPADSLEIPPNSVTRNDGYYRLTRPTRIDAMQPHMHMRGKAMTLEAILLNNTTQVLSSVDHYDFHWQINYEYADDVAPLLPAGTVLHFSGIHDNTAANKRNPDPDMWVGFGERSVDDMDKLWLDVVYLDQAEFDRLVAERKAKESSASNE
jgi:mono/diheme cytochrome c family protein